MSERSEKALRDDLQRIVDAGLAWQTSTGNDETFVFKHVLVQVAAYESLLRTTRQRYHESIARALLSDFQDRRGAPARSRGTPSLGRWAPRGGERLLVGRGAECAEAHGDSRSARALCPRARRPQATARVAGYPDQGTRSADRDRPDTDDGARLGVAVRGGGMRAGTHALPAVESARQALSAVWGLWTNLFVGGLLDRALVTANEALAMALASGVPMLEVTGRHAVAYTHYYRGEWSEAIPHAEAALALYSLEQERALTSTFQMSSTVNLVAALGSSLWMMGHQDRALQELDRMISIARDVNHPSALSNALGVACYMLTFHHDPPRMLRLRRGSEELRSRGGMGALVCRRRDEQRVGASAHG